MTSSYDSGTRNIDIDVSTHSTSLASILELSSARTRSTLPLETLVFGILVPVTSYFFLMFTPGTYLDTPGTYLDTYRTYLDITGPITCYLMLYKAAQLTEDAESQLDRRTIFSVLVYNNISILLQATLIITKY